MILRSSNVDLAHSVNGCGLKSQENLDGVKAIPLERLMLETGKLEYRTA